MMRNKVFKVAGVALLSTLLVFTGARVFAWQAAPEGTIATLPVTLSFPPMTFTASGQTATQRVSGCSSAIVKVSGTGLATVTWQLEVSNDGGAHYFGVPSLAAAGTITSGVLPVTTAGTITTTSAALYIFNLSGATNFEVVTSGTFTATSVAVKVTCSSNRNVL